jgi:hypothetical protein
MAERVHHRPSLTCSFTLGIERMSEDLSALQAGG